MQLLNNVATVAMYYSCYMSIVKQASIVIYITNYSEVPQVTYYKYRVLYTYSTHSYLCLY